MRYFNTPNVEDYPFLSEEVREYFTIPKKRSGMPVDFAVDNNYFCNIYNHEIWLYFRNGYEDSPNFEWLPIIISTTPYVPFDWKCKISDIDFDKIKKFVIINRNALIRLIYSGGINELQAV